jgi:hypothetical protein
MLRTPRTRKERITAFRNLSNEHKKSSSDKSDERVEYLENEKFLFSFKSDLSISLA